MILEKAGIFGGVKSLKLQVEGLNSDRRGPFLRNKRRRKGMWREGQRESGSADSRFPVPNEQ